MKTFSEYERLKAVLRAANGYAEVRTLAHVRAGDAEFPIIAIVAGSRDPQAPTLGVFGGVHGLERIGSDVAISFLGGFFEQMAWDESLRERMKSCRLVVLPIVNPGGMYLGMRSNPNHVDLMRNSPVEAVVKPVPILGGHRLSRRLPYYRGEAGAPMEVESRALIELVEQEMFGSKVAIALDLHSGFGARDRLWYPYAKTTEPFPRLRETLALMELLTRSYPNHVYKIESQSVSYTTHGDLWDHLFDEHARRPESAGSIFIPLTLEMGSWIWIRKNPAQLFSLLGTFNPVKQHRFRRTMRRHVPLIDFLLRAVKHHSAWI